MQISESRSYGISAKYLWMGSWDRWKNPFVALCKLGSIIMDR
jgi:hypothetical protein